MDSQTMEGLRARFPAFNADLCDNLFSEDQPGEILVQSQGRFPAVIMKNGTAWFWDKTNRALNSSGAPMKAKAPRGGRALLFDDPEATEIALVEGEADLVACVSLGIKGVCCVGGVKSMMGSAGQQNREKLRGKTVRILFDPDEPGREGAAKVAQALRSIAGRVAVCDLSRAEGWAEGQDIEDYLKSLDPEIGRGRIERLLGGISFDGPEKKEGAPEVDAIPVQSKRLTTPHGRVALAAVWDPEDKRLRLAVRDLREGAPDLAGPFKSDKSAMHTEDTPEKKSDRWEIRDDFTIGDTLYVPETDSGTLELIADGTLTPPIMPWEGKDTSEGLWKDLHDFAEGWVLLDDGRLYDVLVGYVFLTYRLIDAGFPYVPYIRFHGPPSSGKGRGAAVLRALCWRSFFAQATASNLHRLADSLGDISLIFDEFHLDRSRGEVDHEMVDALCLGYQRGGSKLRCEKTADGRAHVERFALFGPKIFAGYGTDEDEGLARRTISICMRKREDVPESMDLLALPARFYTEAEALRARLMAWRGRKLDLGMPDPEGPRAREMKRRVGNEFGQAFWPVTEMVPEVLTEARENLLRYGESRKKATDKTRETSKQAMLLQTVCELACDGSSVALFKDGKPVEGVVFLSSTVLVSGVHERQGDRTATAHSVVRQLKSAGVPHTTKGRIRDAFSAKGTCLVDASGFVLTLSGQGAERLTEVMREAGVTWPPDVQDEEAPV